MNELSKIGTLPAAIIAELLLGEVVPNGFVKESWRLPVAIALVLAGIALAVFAWSIW